MEDRLPDLRNLNANERVRTALIAVPQTSKVRDVHCLDLGTLGIGQVFPIANKILELFGEGGTVGCPNVMMFDQTIMDKQHMNLLNPSYFDSWC